MTESGMREILLHGSPDEAFDRSVLFARRMAESGAIALGGKGEEYV